MSSHQGSSRDIGWNDGGSSIGGGLLPVPGDAATLEDLHDRTTGMFNQLASLAEIVENLALSVRANNDNLEDAEIRMEKTVDSACDRLNETILSIAMDLRRDMAARDEEMWKEISSIRRLAEGRAEHSGGDARGQTPATAHRSARSVDNTWSPVYPSPRPASERTPSPRRARDGDSPAGSPSTRGRTNMQSTNSARGSDRQGGDTAHQNRPQASTGGPPGTQQRIGGGFATEAEIAEWKRVQYERRQTPSPSPPANRALARRDSQNRMVENGGRPAAPGMTEAVTEVLRHFEETVTSVFMQYSSWTPKGGGTQLMSRIDFVKFVKDCHVPQKTNPAIADLVFLKVSLAQNSPGNGSPGRPATSPPPASYGFGGGVDAHEFDIIEFRQALVMLANAVHASRDSLTSAQKLREFLVNGVQVVAIHNEDMRFPDPRVRNNNVQTVLSAYRRQMRKVYDHYAGDKYNKKTGPRKAVRQIGCDDFLDLLREYDLKGVISNGYAKSMFEAALKRRIRAELSKQGGGGTEKKPAPVIEPQVDFDEFLDLLGTIALHIYGAPMYAEAYPNPEDKVQKLLVKLVVLQNPVSSSVRGLRIKP